MREIKFRGKTKEGKWVYGLLNIDVFDCYFIEWIKQDKKRRKFKDYEQVIPETVGQFTGLKDKNGVEIYEGDVIQKLPKWCSIIKYNIDYCKYECETYFKGEFHSITLLSDKNVNKWFKVIGNIHDK